MTTEGWRKLSTIEGADGRHRCGWVGTGKIFEGKAFYEEYHDQE